MKIFDNLFPINLYHSYIVEGDPEITSFHLHKFLEERGEIAENSPDVLIRIYDSFNIDDSHKIKEWHNEMAITSGKRICIIGAKFINHDAERTLLKIIEEPAQNTHFFLVVPNSLVLLDTIRSRAHIVKSLQARPVENNSDFAKIAKEFVEARPKDRIEIVAKLIKENKNEDSSSNLRFVAIQLINEIEKIIFQKFKKNLSAQAGPKDEHLIFILKELEKSREFLNLPGAGVKMILEHISIVL